MATLADVRANVADMLRGRTDLNSQIDIEIGNAIRHYSRRATWITDRRNGTIATVAGTEWYSTIDLSSSAGISDTSVGTLPSATADLVDMISMDYAKIEQGTTDWPLAVTSYRTFESLRENSNVRGTPRYISRYSGRIGLWPAPNAVYTVSISGNFKPIVPSSGTDESAFFDQHRELIDVATTVRMAQKWTHDAELVSLYAPLVVEQERLLTVEGNTRRGTGKARSSW
jgi:hypothetical protein